MAEEIGFENGRNSNFQGLVTWTLYPVIGHTVVHHSSTSTYIPNFIEIEETFCGRMDVRTFSPALILLGRLLEVDLKMNYLQYIHIKTNAKKTTNRTQLAISCIQQHSQ